MHDVNTKVVTQRDNEETLNRKSALPNHRDGLTKHLQNHRVFGHHMGPAESSKCSTNIQKRDVVQNEAGTNPEFSLRESNH